MSEYTDKLFNRWLELSKMETRTKEQESEMEDLDWELDIETNIEAGLRAGGYA